MSSDISTPTPTPTPPAAITSGSAVPHIFDHLRKPVSRLAALVVAFAFIFTGSAIAPLERTLLQIIGLLMVFAAVLGRLWCAHYISGRKNTELLTDGPYSLCRNPLYFFSFLGFVGIGLSTGHFALSVIMSGFFLLYYHYVIRAEEINLHRIFGQPFVSYISQTPRFWPHLGGYHTRPTITFEPHRIGIAFRDIVWFIIALAAVQLLNYAHAQSLLPIIYTWPF